MNDRRTIFLNAVFYVVGFSFVFILFGTLFGLGGAAFLQYRWALQRVGGALVIFFGLFMLKIFQLPGFDFLNEEKHFPLIRALKPGRPVNSFLFGAAFALGWTPCIGPILGSILTLAAASATVGRGAFLLGIFSLGLAMPFLLVAASIGSAEKMLKKFARHSNTLSFVGGIFLIILGLLMLTDTMNAWTGLFYQGTRFMNYQALLNYL